ncbi:hypothetical protein RR48_06870 [Papilio machaon]|uniref:Uncharacterized protein n=1 Tax=Papilio machaon TaxID=76193 RepID=A0A194RFI5_PAPMA|nr:hypothetical protein RR48_06870 [Papilio machaon]
MSASEVCSSACNLSPVTSCPTTECLQPTPDGSGFTDVNDDLKLSSYYKLRERPRLRLSMSFAQSTPGAESPPRSRSLVTKPGHVVQLVVLYVAALSLRGRRAVAGCERATSPSRRRHVAATPAPPGARCPVPGARRPVGRQRVTKDGNSPFQRPRDLTPNMFLS